MKVVLVHGIHEKEGDSNMSALLPHLRRHLPDTEIVVHAYGFMGFWQARWNNNRQAARLADVLDDGDVVVTHSNGAAIAYLAVRDYGARPVGIININPALDRWLAASVQWVETIHSDGDRWVWLSQWLPGHIWGDQGKVGYRGGSQRVLNHHASSFGGVMAYQGHCDLFSGKRIEKWAAFISVRIEERLDEAVHWARENQRLAALFASIRPDEPAK